MGHDWKEADCTNPKTCTVCGETEGDPAGHQWLDATCAAPKTCKVCKETDGQPTNVHDWKDMTLENPRTCKVCKKTEGRSLNQIADVVTDVIRDIYQKNPGYATFVSAGMTDAHTYEINFLMRSDAVEELMTAYIQKSLSENPDIGQYVGYDGSYEALTAPFKEIGTTFQGYFTKAEELADYGQIDVIQNYYNMDTYPDAASLQKEVKVASYIFLNDQLIYDIYEDIDNMAKSHTG